LPFTYDSERNIVFIDYSDLTAEQLMAEAERVHEKGRTHLGKAARVLVDITGTKLNGKAVQALKDTTRGDRALVERTAVVGVTGVKKILADAIARFSGTNTHYFDTKEAALEWLTKP
jgi:hypothetical protein